MRTATIERLRVRYGETDQMGHAYYGNYLLWFEQARGAWCRDRGFTYKSLEAMGYKLPVVEVFIRYKGEVVYDDLLEIEIELGEVRRASMQFVYKIRRSGEDPVLTEGHTWHVLMGEERRAITIPPSVRELLDRDPDACETVT
ncbi:MAG: acyl-CoA thioesterase [Fimbriimonadaceae bacterium]